MDNSNHTEQHTFQFRGVFIPADVLHKLLDGEIDKTELMVLVMVDSLVTSKGPGCFATNGYFASSLGLSVKRIEAAVSSLRKQGLLTSYYQDWKGGNRRFLETSWSRVRPPSRNEGLPPSPGEGGGSSQNEGHNTYKNEQYKNKGEGAGAPVPPISRKPTGMDVAARTKVSFTPAMLYCAKRLRKILRLHRPVWPVTEGSYDYWAEQLQVLANRLQGDTDQIDDLLDWMEANINTIKKPTITCAKQFVQHFSWLQDQMNKVKENPKAALPDPSKLPEYTKHTVVEMRKRVVKVQRPDQDGYLQETRLHPTKVTYATTLKGSRMVWEEYSVEGDSRSFSQSYEDSLPTVYEDSP